MPNNIQNIPSHLPFLDTIAGCILGKYGGNPLIFSNITIFLPNRRACRSLRESFLLANNGIPMLLPKILPLGDMDDEDFIFKMDYDLPNLISSTEQRLILTKLIEKWQNLLKTGEKITVPQAAHLAIDLASFLGEVEKEQLSFMEIESIVPEELAGHWQITVDFLRILIEEWPKILESRNAVDIHIQRNISLNMQAEEWQNNPPEYPVIAAGSTGSIPSAANLLKVIAALPGGMVILPGLDTNIDEESWENIKETHPQYGLKRLLEHIGAKRNEVNNWNASIPNDTAHSLHTPKGKGSDGKDSIQRACRTAIISEIMRPGITTSKWRDIRGINEKSFDGIKLITTSTIQEEATLISLIMKKALQIPGTTAALVTNHRDLAKRVSTIMQKWNVEIDDSAGYELNNTAQAVFLRLLAQVTADKITNPVSLLKCLKHPLATCGMLSVEFRNNVRKLEILTLRKVRNNDGIKGLYKILEKKNSDYLEKWLKTVEKTLSPMADFLSRKTVSFEEMLIKHIEVAEQLAATNTESGADRMWSGTAGERLKEFLDELLLASVSIKEIDPIDFAGLFDALLIGQTYRPSYGTHPRLSVLSPIEARMLSFDLVIMGELNEGSWPATGKADPWMSRPMRKNFGLPLPEKKIGQSAHDFAQLFCSPEVVMTRCEKSDGTQTIPSRWLLRLEAVLNALKMRHVIKPEEPWLKWVELLNKPEKTQACTQPSPKPPVNIRPKELYVTSIEKLMRDPYSIYASKILSLKALDPLDQDPGAADFGNFIHDALEIFITKYEETDDKHGFLLECGREVLKQQNPGEAVVSFWWPRFERIAKWFIINEERRREGEGSVISETEGEYRINCKNGTFILKAIADRVELNAEGDISIIDYKTGALPANREIELGLSPQMTLEGVIANNNGFKIQGKTTELSYWRLTGGEPPAEEKPLKEIADRIKEAEEGIKNLINAFLDKDMPYLACPNQDESPVYNDYKHLERIGEWE